MALDHPKKVPLQLAFPVTSLVLVFEKFYHLPDSRYGLNLLSYFKAQGEAERQSGQIQGVIEKKQHSI